MDASPDAAFELDLGHVLPVISLTRRGDRGLSIDFDGHWALWDLGAAARMVSGDLECAFPSGCERRRAELAPGLLVIETGIGLELRAATTGQLTTIVPVVPSNWGVASDGSYVWAATTTAVQVWDASGALVRALPGDYRTAQAFAAPGELRVIGGAAGERVVERIPLPDGTPSVSAPFSGSFRTWFTDGEHFLTVTGTTVWVYSRLGAQVGFGSLQLGLQVGGSGAYVWTHDPSASGNQLSFYVATDLATPIATYALEGSTKVVPSRDTVAALPIGWPTARVFRLGATVTEDPPVTLPVEYLSAYGSDGNAWLLAAGQGVILDGIGATPAASLSRGRMHSVSGTTDGIAAIATDGGGVLMLRAGAPVTMLPTLPWRSSHVELSTDAATAVIGPFLGSSQYRDDRTLRVVDVATRAETYAWLYTWSTWLTSRFFDFGFARGGDVVCHAINSSTPRSCLLTTTAGAPVTDVGPALIFEGGVVGRAPHFSPSGARAAVTMDGNASSSASTLLYQDSALAGAVDGIDLGWLDEDHVLIAHYDGPGGRWSSTTIHTVDGTLTGPSGLREITPLTSGSSPMRGAMVPAGGGAVYVPVDNAVYDAVTGNTLWRGPALSVGGGVAGDHVVYMDGVYLKLAPFR